MTTAAQALSVRDAIEREMAKLGRGATGPSTRLLASLTGHPQVVVLSVLRNMQQNGQVTGRRVREGGDLHWVPPELDTIAPVQPGMEEMPCPRCGRVIAVSAAPGGPKIRKHRQRVLEDADRKRGVPPAPWCVQP